ncbi:MAG TPA: DsbA family protein, partial [Kofleriaceae bacterium]|nr:DsbA family protein [Kofleriaceae bacterium]
MRSRLSPALLALLLLPLAACERAAGPKEGAGGGAAAANPDAPTLELFVMSQCPYGVQVVDAAAEAKKKLGPDLNLVIDYIGQGTAGNLSSMHGPSEVKGDLAQVCARELAPDRYLDMTVCQNQDMRSVATNWKQCAEKSGIDVAALGACIDGEQGQKLLAASFDRAKARGATGSPTMYLGGEKYEGGRKARDFMRAACAAMGEKPAAACKEIPVPPKVSAVFLSDARCAECDIRGLEPRLRSILGGIEVKHLDYGSPEGKALYDQLVAAGAGFQHLPAVLLGPEVEKDSEGYPEIERFLRPVGDYRELRLGGTFDPKAEICGNDGVDDDGDGAADCKDKDCAETLGCRPRKPKTLDLFVMSQCPYGARALIAAQEFVDHMGKDVKL